MSVLIVGSTALDSIKTPKAENPRLLGGSASHAAVAASFFGPVKLVGVVGDDSPCSHYADVMTRVLGRNAVYQNIPRDVYAKFPFPGAEELAAMFEFNRLYIPNRKADLEQCRKLYPAMQNFRPG